MKPRLSGPIRLGILLSATWIVITLLAYFLVIWLHPNAVTRHIPWAFSWLPTGEEFLAGKDISTSPDASPVVYALSLLPIVVGWLVFFVIPRSIRWVIEGFRNS